MRWTCPACGYQHGAPSDEAIRQAVEAKKESVASIAKRLQCGMSTVYAIKKRLGLKGRTTQDVNKSPEHRLACSVAMKARYAKNNGASLQQLAWLKKGRDAHLKRLNALRLKQGLPLTKLD